MPFLSLRSNPCIALCFFLLASIASLAAETVEIDVGEVSSNRRDMGGVDLRVTAVIYFGCIDSGTFYGHTGTSDGMYNVPSSPASATHSFPLQGWKTMTLPESGAPVDFTVNASAYAVLSKSGQRTDHQTVNVIVKGKCKYVSGSTMKQQSVRIVFTLKSGGPSEGKGRLDNRAIVGSGEEDPGELVDLFSYIPNYETGVNGQTGAPRKPVPIDIGGRTGSIPVGSSWQQIRVPTGSSGSLFIPTWLPSNAGRTGSGASNPGFLYQPDFPAPRGDPPYPAPITVTSGPTGTHVSGGFPGDMLDLKFPKGYKPSEVDLREPKPEPPSSLNVDPCFSYALDQEGLPPPGMEPGGPGLPPGITPGGTLPLPGIPGTIPGLPPGTILPPGIELPPGVGGGSGGTGGSVTLPSGGGGSGGGSGGGTVVVQPPTAPDGQAPAIPGEGLPEDDASQALTDKIAGKFNDAVGKIQGAVGGLTGKGSIQNASFGQASTWVLSFTVAGQNHTFEIPTTHAQHIRGVLHVMLVAIFLFACYNLLLGK